MLNQLLVPTLITSYSIQNKRPRILYSWHEEGSRYLVWPIISAVTSAPGFFAPILIKSIHHKYTDTLIDGAIFANNPSGLALSQSLIIFPHKKYVLVSIGTGHHITSVSDKVLHWGKLQWVKKLIPIVIDAQTLNIDMIMFSIATKAIMPELDYYHFDTIIPEENTPLDDASQKNIDALNQLGEKAVEQNKSRLNQLAQELIKT